MEKEKCVCCCSEINDKYEYDEEGKIWCVPCFLTESDIGE
jgi:hypothetical protein